ncbi:hypothetical protein BD289DRAFT_269317 [Coniella lustricola]|uniref:Uncharacterized protein n=1 Tax=Coniella lustricola TaxID=2025994 RepID=A0A2T3AKA0_9PEZI|nr:hypothetical protein BD289DRAFT_269317 [Coniella lustricola]
MEDGEREQGELKGEERRRKGGRVISSQARKKKPNKKKRRGEKTSKPKYKTSLRIKQPHSTMAACPDLPDWAQVETLAGPGRLGEKGLELPSAGLARPQAGGITVGEPLIVPSRASRASETFVEAGVDLAAGRPRLCQPKWQVRPFGAGRAGTATAITNTAWTVRAWGKQDGRWCPPAIVRLGPCGGNFPEQGVHDGAQVSANADANAGTEGEQDGAWSQQPQPAASSQPVFLLCRGSIRGE